MGCHAHHLNRFGKLLSCKVRRAYLYELKPMLSDQRSFDGWFFGTKPNAKSLLALFEVLPNAFFYAKNKESRFVYVNKRMLEIYNLDDLDFLIGKTDRDFHPPALAEAYIAEDKRVMESKRPILNQTWLVPHILGTPKWYVSSKVPLWEKGKVAGIAGAMYLIETPKDQSERFGELKPAIDYMAQNFSDNISMESMAQLVGVSSTLFNRRFRELLRLTPTAYLLTLRIQEARKLLVQTNHSLVDIGCSVGFYDQGHFSRRFQKATGLTPGAYRKSYRTS